MAFDVIVAGLGVMGSATAWQLARRGRAVLGLDRFRPPHARGSSHGGSRIIREMAFEHPRYVPIAQHAHLLWDALAAETGRRDLLIPTGALYIGAPDSGIVGGSRTSAVAHGIPYTELPAADVNRRWPAFQPDPGMVGLLEARAGVLRPEACVEAMIAAAGKHAGVELRFDEPMLAWGSESDGSVWVRTPSATYRAAALVLTTGPWMAEPLQEIGVTVTIERVVQHYFAPRDAYPLDPARCPVYLFEDADGVVFYGFPLLGGALKAAVHHRGAATTADTVRREVGADEVALTRGYLERWLPAAAGRHLDSAVCLYTNTADGQFLIDRDPRHAQVLLASPCSGIGFKFAPAIGEILADLATGAAPRFDLTPFRARRS